MVRLLAHAAALLILGLGLLALTAPSKIHANPLILRFACWTAQHASR